MRASPRTRRLRSDLKVIKKLTAESSILDFSAGGEAPEAYTIRFNGRGLWRYEGSTDVITRDYHEMTIGFGASYPRMMPELSWKTPIFHPNISASGVVCLGGYGTHWVPSLRLDELCHMLWDMVRYKNFDVESPYNREAAAWAKTQQQLRLPLDDRSLRDLVAQQAAGSKSAGGSPSSQIVTAEVLFLDNEDDSIVDAQIIDAAPVSNTEPDILFID